MLHWIKFNVVGVLGFALQSGALFVLTHRASPINYLAATAVAVELAVLNNFVWHQRWTWSDRPSATKKETLRRLAKFNITTGLVSITGNLMLSSVVVGPWRVLIFSGNVVTLFTCSLLSFILADRIAFDTDSSSTA